MSLPVTPVKNSVYSAFSMEHEMNQDPSRDISDPRQNGLTIPQINDMENPAVPRLGKKPQENTQSQVRFSIPDPNVLSQNSPLKIVFPKSENDIERKMSTSSLFMNSHGHLVDMHSKVLIDVPEEIWKFHHGRKMKSEKKHRRTRSDVKSNTSGNAKLSNHSRSRSLQSIIVDTMNTYRAVDADSTFNGNISNVSQVSPLNLSFDKPPLLTPEKHLYLTPESPLNRYHLPVPLEISLPPYLSPKNKHKQRNSLVYDGDGYSQFQESNTSLSTESSVEQPSSSYSEENNSIPYAHHDVSFELSNADPDKFLGIDENANVNLKIQKKNLKSPHHSKEKACGRREEEDFFEKNESLKILSTPNKLIDIPDLGRMTSPPSTGFNGTLKFFQQFEPHEEPASPNHNVNRKSQDNLDMSFKFPCDIAGNNIDKAPANRNSVNSNNEDFLKIDNSPVNQSFESRRQMLMDLQKSPTINDPRLHKHRRSRSVHNIDDTFLEFDATSTPPAPASAPILPVKDSTPYTSPEIPKRSPLRFKSSTNSPDTSPNSQPPDNVSFQQEMSVPSIQIIADETTSREIESSIGYPESEDDQQHSSIKDADQSIAIIGEINDNLPVEPFKPLSSFTSFSQPITNNKSTPLGQDLADSVGKQPTYVTPHSVPFNVVSPKRQISNSDSSKSSSYNSEFSSNTAITDTTSQPSIAINRTALQQNLINNKQLKKNGFCPPPKRDSYSFPRKKATPVKKGDLEFNTIYEKRDGKMVEVILLDEDEDISFKKDNNAPRLPTNQTQKTKDEQGKKRLSQHIEVLDMCEKTADEAKKIIYQLVNETTKYPEKEHSKKQIRSRVLPPLPFPLYDENGNSLIPNRYERHIHNDISSRRN